MGSGLLCGVGINDADYVVQRTINGKRVWCPFYMAWNDMLRRCYSAKFHSDYPTYIGCSVDTEWLTFSNFKSWMQMQDWVGKYLDKDLLFFGNKVYSSETCVFVDSVTNIFVTNRAAARGKWPLGVNLNKSTGKLRAYCNNPFTKKLEHLGYFTRQDIAHQAWKKRKHELACQLADLQTDIRVAAALRARYA